jgi:hypothetical protein
MNPFEPLWPRGGEFNFNRDNLLELTWLLAFLPEGLQLESPGRSLGIVLFRPFRADDSLTRKPRAAPWAFELQPVGPMRKAQTVFHDPTPHPSTRRTSAGLV